MSNCRVVDCAKDSITEEGLCLAHFRRFVNGIIKIVPGEPIWDYCDFGHKLTADNVRWERTGRGDSKRRRCRMCLSIRAQRNAQRNPTVKTPEPYRPNDTTLTKALADFDLALAQPNVRAKCHNNPGPYMDWDERNPPTAEEAAKLCSGCPLMRACANAQKAAREPFGIWGGRVIIDGRFIHKKKGE